MSPFSPIQVTNMNTATNHSTQNGSISENSPSVPQVPCIRPSLSLVSPVQRIHPSFECDGYILDDTSDVGSDIYHSTDEGTNTPNALLHLESDEDEQGSLVSRLTDYPHHLGVLQAHPGSITSHENYTNEVPPRFDGMFKLLNINMETGSGDLDQASLGQFINYISPGAFESISDINIQDMERTMVKPVGVYGSKSEIIRFLTRIGSIKLYSDSSIQLPTLPQLTPLDMTPGLYALARKGSSSREVRLFIIFWPDDETWDDGADITNRESRHIFISYLYRITNHVIALISTEHEKNLVWEEDVVEEQYDKPFSLVVQEVINQDINIILQDGIKHFDNHIKGQDIPIRLIGGESKQGLLTTLRNPPKKVKRNFRDKTQFAEILSQENSMHAIICLDRDLSYDAILYLEGSVVKRGLEIVFSNFLRRDKSITDTLEKDKEINAKRMLSYLEETRTKLSDAFVLLLVNKAVEKNTLLEKSRLYEHLEIPTPSPSDESIHKSFLDGLCESHTSLRALLEKHPKSIFCPSLYSESSRISRSRALRSVFICKHLFENNDLNHVERESISRLVRERMGLETHDSTLVPHSTNSTLSIINEINYDSTNFKNVFTSPLVGVLFGPVDEARVASRALKLTELLNKENAERMEDSWPELQPNIEAATNAAIEHYSKTIKEYVEVLCNEVLDSMEQNCRSAIREKLNEDHARRKKESLREFFDELECDHGSSHVSESATLLKCLTVNKSNIEGFFISHKASCIKYEIHRLELAEGDVLRPVSAPEQSAEPDIEANSRAACYHFKLPEAATIKLIRLLGDGKCLVVIENHDLDVYLEALDDIKGAISHKRYKKCFKRRKLGDDIRLAYDEKTRKFLICGVKKQPPVIQIRAYRFTDEYRSLKKTDRFDLASGYAQGVPPLCDAHLISGCDEIALVGTSGMVRVVSVGTQQFRPAVLHLPPSPNISFTTPDGSYLGVVYLGNDKAKVIFHHLATLGSHSSLSYAQHHNVMMSQTPIISTLGDKRNIHLLWLDTSSHSCISTKLVIPERITSLQLRKRQEILSKSAHTPTLNNSLIDCHPEVWSRSLANFGRKQKNTSIIFTTTEPSCFPFHNYFQNMIQELERSTKKSRATMMNETTVTHALFEDMIGSLQGSEEASTLKAGEWIVDILCLVPIQIALARDNQFIPIKDGVFSPDLEKSLSEMDVETIAGNLSFGWYESIFRSYISSKNVKVISIMRKRSSEDVFSLDCLVSVPLVGLARRVYEGVWMSVKPQNDSLVVVLDFEGLGDNTTFSQDNMMISLFSIAMSNIVFTPCNSLLRENITDLFQCLQKTSSIIDPCRNPTLFQCSLILALKDWANPDHNGVKKKIREELGKIVEEEGSANFLTRLFKNRVDIVPWPQSNASLIDMLENHLRSLNSHESGRDFVAKMKMLLAKIRNNDWRPISHNISVQKSHYILRSLNGFLSMGLPSKISLNQAYKEAKEAPITYLDDNDAIFYIENEGDYQVKKEDALKALIRRWPENNLRGKISDQIWTTQLCNYLNELADKRISHVQSWIKDNLSQFQASGTVVEELRRAMETKIIEIKRGISICKVQCEDCHLLCLHPPFHSGRHDCDTDHTCQALCECIGHDIPLSCDLISGHDGDHICASSVHLCGKPCTLSAKKGCQNKCMKTKDHSDSDHLCSARHFCGKPCSLKNAQLHDGSTFTCNEFCILPWNEAHDQHKCSSVSCTIKCDLCDDTCIFENHLHGLKGIVRHLCGNRHVCSSPCQSHGVCEIGAVSHSPETFKGVFEQFKYTKYSQTSKRLKCAKHIPAGRLQHDGPHIHSTLPDITHSCNKSCDNCGYLCTLPYGHANEHSTSHGSMFKTKWAIEGTNNSIQIGNHKFGSSDNGGPLLCSMICRSLDRHVHIDYCQENSQICSGPESSHIMKRMEPDPQKAKDWITHNLYWKRQGFQDPYSKEERENFTKCDALCPDPMHEPHSPSYCDLTLFHRPCTPTKGVSANGYVSNDGHSFLCKMPESNPPYHIILVIDRSGSMSNTDKAPPPGSPLILQSENNRLGSVYSAVYEFMKSRNMACTCDTVSIILFSHSAIEPDGGTDFNQALILTKALMLKYWSPERPPVVIFLSDGESEMDDTIMRDLCQSALQRGYRHPLSFHAVSFGLDAYSYHLKRMACIAQEVQDGSGEGQLSPLSTSVDSSYTDALDSVHLRDAFLNVSNSLRRTRGGLI